MFRQTSSVRKLCLGLVSALGMSASVALAGPEIEVVAILTDANGVQVQETVQDGAGSTLNLTDMVVGDEQLVTFFISNIGDENLVLDAPESVSLVANPTAGYALLNQPPAPTIGPGGSRLFRLTVTPQQAGFAAATMFIFGNAENTENANGTFRVDLLASVEEEIEIVDCNENGEDDADDLNNGVSEDCNFNFVPDECELDTDGDGFIDDCDNCPNNANPDQLDSDDNGLGDACDIELCEIDAVLCGADGVTYQDSCEAAEAGTTVDYLGECEEEEELECPDVYEPVCGIDGHTYSSSCHADAAEMIVDYDGECEEEDEIDVCDQEFAPVCGTDGHTYSNSCHASSAGTTVDHDGPCEVGQEAEGNEDDEVEDDPNQNDDQDQNDDLDNDTGNQNDQDEDQGKDNEQNQDDENNNGFCGAGLLGMVPLMMLGFGGLKTGRTRRR